ncbi:MAG TPA: NUDIX hydrolase [Myxococcota bacterium]|jgi:8-oxo-dGTP pyrophosphatase MutT (NUDIX family)|nr:NUDIX hydrolase [Myxococcota bacterium]
MAAPRLAATVVLLRETPPPGRGFEVFFVKRHENSGFMGGAHVFPGGKLDAADRGEALLAACDGRTAEACAARLGTPDAAGLHVAALRELFEEAGALLADRGAALPAPDFADPAEAARFAAHRRALDARQKPFGAVVAEERLHLRVDRLHYWAHWITPEVEPRRFDAYFFVAALPAGQAPLHDARETVASAWLAPDEALARHKAGDIALPPPTLRNVELLALHPTVSAVCAAADAADPPVILPTVDQVDGKLALLLPGDPLYRPPPEVPAPGGTPRGLGGATRFVLDAGRWYTRTA